MKTESDVETFICPLLVLNLLFNSYMCFLIAIYACPIRLTTEVFAKKYSKAYLLLFSNS